MRGEGMKKLLLSLVCGLSLCACAPQSMRMVDTVDAPQFVSMSRAMRPVMLKKQLVDYRGSWYSPSPSILPFDAGVRLVQALSPAFLESDEFSGKTFRASLSRNAVMETERFTASLRQNGLLVSLALTAVTDWDGDGKDDWLVSCRLGRAESPREYREYFLVIENVKAAVLQPKVLLVQDCSYGQKTVVAEPFHSELADSKAAEFLQGETDVTQAPAGHVRRQLEDSPVRQSALSR